MVPATPRAPRKTSQQDLLLDDTVDVPLILVAHDLCDIAADWRSWSEAYRIPMLMVEADGIALLIFQRQAGTTPFQHHLVLVAAVAGNLLVT